MKNKVTKVVSRIVLNLAKKSSNSACDWRFFQPKVPKKLLDK